VIARRARRARNASFCLLFPRKKCFLWEKGNWEGGVSDVDGIGASALSSVVARRSEWTQGLSSKETRSLSPPLGGINRCRR